MLDQIELHPEEDGKELTTKNGSDLVSSQDDVSPGACEISLSEQQVGVSNKQGSLFSSLNDELLLKEIASIPDKLGFKIGDVAEMLGIKQYVLRYWETEFDLIRPKKALNNQRLYTKKDVENIYLIRKLLYRDRFSIEGARSVLKNLKSQVRKDKDKENKDKEKNKEWINVQSKMDLLHDQVDEVLEDIRNLKKLF